METTRKFICFLFLIAALTGAQPTNDILPDLSAVTAAIPRTPAPESVGKFSSEMQVPAINLQAAATEAARQLRERIEASVGQQRPELRRGENHMPDVLARIESSLDHASFVTHDMGNAVAFFFFAGYQAATGKTVAKPQDSAGAKIVATAAAAAWRARFDALSPADKEAVYTKLLIVPTLLLVWSKQYDTADMPMGVRVMRQTATDLFREVFGISPSQVAIDSTGRRITLLTDADAQAAANAPMELQPADQLAAPPELAAQVFVKYEIPIIFIPHKDINELLLFPDGTAINNLPRGPIANLELTTLKAALDPTSVGRWKQLGNHLDLTFGGKTTTFEKDFASGGWADPKQRKDQWFIYFPVIAPTAALLEGGWQSKGVSGVGMMPGGATPKVIAGVSGDLVFLPDGTFAKAGRGFALGTTVNMGPAFEVGPDVMATEQRSSNSKGQWRLDGLQLTTLENGRRGVQLVYFLPHFTSDNKPTDIMIQGMRWFRPQQK